MLGTTKTPASNNVVVVIVSKMWKDVSEKKVGSNGLAPIHNEKKVKKAEKFCEKPPYIRIFAMFKNDKIQKCQYILSYLIWKTSY